MLAYLRLLIKDRLLTLRPTANEKKGHSKARAIWIIIGFSLLTLMLYAMVVALEYFVFQGFKVIGQAEGALAVTFLICVFITLLMSFLMVFNTLFFSRDLEFASALPISSRGLLADKLILIVLGEAISALFLCLPVVILYGLYIGGGFLYYLKALLLVPLLPMIAMALITLLSFLLIRISALWKRREGMTTLMTFLLIAGIMAVQISFSMRTGDEEEFGRIILRLVMRQSVLVDLFVKSFPPIGWLCNALIQTGWKGWGYGIAFILASIASVVFVVSVLGGQYQRLAIKQSEVVARLNATAKKRNKGIRMHSPFGVLYRREIKELITVPAYATNCLTSLVMFPVMTVVMMMSMGKNSDGIPDIPSLLANQAPTILFLVLLAVFCLTCFMNVAVATAVSREGKRHYFSKIIPVPASTQLLAKLAMGLSVDMAAVLLTAGTVCVVLPELWLLIMIAALAATPFALLSSTMGLLLDVYFPRLDWKTETDAVKRNVNGVYGMFGTMALLGLLVAGYFGLGALGFTEIWSILLIHILLILVDVLLMKWLIGKASMVYALHEKNV